VPELPDGAGLALEAADVLVVLGEVRVEDLESHPALDPLLPGLPDLAHPAASQKLEGVEAGDHRGGFGHRDNYTGCRPGFRRLPGF
jgi:hypothetical protein